MENYPLLSLSTMGLYRDKTGTIPGQDRDKTGTRPGQDRDKTWTRPGQDLDKTGTIPGQDRDKTGTIPGQDLDKTWTRPGLYRDKTGTRPGQDLLDRARRRHSPYALGHCRELGLLTRAADQSCCPCAAQARALPRAATAASWACCGLAVASPCRAIGAALVAKRRSFSDFHFNL